MTAQSEALDYRLTDADLEEYPMEQRHFDPVIRAAANPDTRVLAAILALKDPRYSPSTFDGCQSALTAAMKAGLKDNVRQLLEANCDPNGVPRDAMSRWSAYFMRRLPHLALINNLTWEQVASEDSRSQWRPLDDEEILARRRTRLPFWAAPTQTRPIQSEPILIALETAVLSENIESVKAVLEAGADVKAWAERHETMPDNPTVSFLCPSTPLHRAIETGNTELVSFLLQEGFRADALPLAAMTRCLNSLMYSLATRSLDLSMYNLLSASPTADHDQVTPVFNVHIAHVACATLSIPALEAVAKQVSLFGVKATALGHTLLHVMSLPRNDNDINHFSRKIHESIHDVRSLDIEFSRKTLWPFKPPGQFRTGKPPFLEPPRDELNQQLSVIALLKSHGIENWGAKDVYGNTPLHYLASHRTATEQKLIGLEGVSVENAWLERNIWGHTPADLVKDGQDALAQLSNEGQRPESVVYMPHWRDPMGWWMGGKWKSDYPEDKS